MMAAVAGAGVTIAAGRAAAGQCGAIEVGGVRSAADPVCAQLVHTLSTRMGLAAALATVVIVLTMAGDQQRRCLWLQFLYLFQQCQSIHSGHLDIAHDGGVLVLSDLLNSCLGRVACIHFDSVQAQV